jgi:nitroreductase
MTTRFSTESARGLPVEVLRAVIRERAHHLLEESLQEALHSGPAIRPRGVATVERLLQVWEERGLPSSADDFVWVKTLLEWAGSQPKETPIESLSDVEVGTVRRLIRERRSIRFWDGRLVPRTMLEEIVRAGQWAPCACDLQTLRVLIVNNPAPEDAALFEGEVTGAPAHLIVCQDRRPYEFYRSSVPEHNRRLDCGAAMQNMLLMAHALGLGAVWLTFVGNQRQAIRQRFRIPDYIDIVSYISLGWPSIEPLPPGRMELEAVLLPNH